MLEYTFWTLVATTLWIVVVGTPDIVATAWLELPSIVWWAIGYLSIFTTAITFFLVQFASMRLPATKVLSYGYLTPGVIIGIEALLGHGWGQHIGCIWCTGYHRRIGHSCLCPGWLMQN